MIKSLFVAVIILSLQGCTIRVIDGTDDYDIQARVTTPECNFDISRTESRSSRSGQVETK